MRKFILACVFAAFSAAPASAERPPILDDKDAPTTTTKPTGK